MECVCYITRLLWHRISSQMQHPACLWSQPWVESFLEHSLGAIEHFFSVFLVENHHAILFERQQTTPDKPTMKNDKKM